MIFCTYEDRATHLIGLKLLVCSVARHMPDLTLHVTCPIADQGDGESLRTFLARYPRVVLSEQKPTFGGWDVKPSLMLRLLDEGHDDVAWIDSDIVLSCDPRPILGAPGAFQVAEELSFSPRKATRLRAAGWGLPVGRDLPHLPNSGFVRAGPAHRPLLAAWQGLIASAPYQETRHLSLVQRPFYMLGDQDVLTSVLCSEEFQDVPVRFLRVSKEILQIGRPGSYAPLDRIRHFLQGSVPALVHAKELKPWQIADEANPFTQPIEYFQLAYHDNSPYTWYARQYADEVGNPSFLSNRSVFGKISEALTGDQPALRGFVLACEDRCLCHLERLKASPSGRRGRSGFCSGSPRATSRLPGSSQLGANVSGSTFVCAAHRRRRPLTAVLAFSLSSWLLSVGPAVAVEGTSGAPPPSTCRGAQP